MTSNNFTSSAIGMAAPGGGLASRRGGQGIKPLSFEAINASNEVRDNGAPTPRTSRSHLLAGLRTAPRTATASSFSTAQQSTSPQPQTFGRAPAKPARGNQEAMNGPKTALPRFSNQPDQFSNLMHMSQQYTPEQVLAPPEIHIDDHSQDQMDPSMYAQLVATNMYLAQQQQRLQQQLLDVQAAAQQFQGLNLNQQQQYLMFSQNQLRNAQVAAAAQPNIYTYVDPVTGQQTYIVDQNTASQLSSQYVDQNQLAQYAALQQLQQQQQQLLQQQMVQQQLQQNQHVLQQQNSSAPRVQVSPPPQENQGSFRTSSPPKRYDQQQQAEPTPLPPPSANAFRRGHKKASSLAQATGLTVSIQDTKSTGPKSAVFPSTPMTGSYGPGQGRAGEHPVRQPRGPPSLEELKEKPTAKFEGSKNFAARTRRSAVHNLVRAGKERRKGGSSNGSMSPVSESAEESETPITDNDSDSGRSGSGSLVGDVDCSLVSSHVSTNATWGAIGSERPGSREKARDSMGSATSVSEADNSFASVFKNRGQRTENPEFQRKSPMLVFTSAEKRKSSNPVVVA